MRNLPATTIINTFDDLFRDINRFAIGFEPMLTRIHNLNPSNGTGYPPYNLDQDGDTYRLELAVAGFKIDELEINLSPDGILSVKGHKAGDKADRNWIHRGIAARNFERYFSLADHVKVMDAKLEDGLLVIELHREIPEPSKGVRIPINRHIVPGSDTNV